ncbi:MAG: stress response translation initiation inhibitor YciH [Chitinivibrionales bacterium]|nr:stress response translation initiation inhibitor YciH [Chitinivibrionales bacterium]
MPKDDLVYSTEHGDLRKKPSRSRRATKKPPSPPPGIKKDGIVRVQRERKGRAGKTVTAVYGLPVQGVALAQLAGKLKQKCGAGGSVKDDVVIIQGDVVAAALDLLSGEGFTVKRAGG